LASAPIRFTNLSNLLVTCSPHLLRGNREPGLGMGGMSEAQGGTAKQIHEASARHENEAPNPGAAAPGHSAHASVSGQAEQGPAHCCPIEQGGLTMLELIDAMKKDALIQEKLVHIIADLVQETVSRNDRR